MPIVELGNAAPLNPDGTRAEIQRTVTVYEFPHDPVETAAQVNLMEYSAEHRYAIRGLPEHLRPYYVHLCDVKDSWTTHHGGDGPDWIESDDASLAELLADFYGCPVGRPEGWVVG